MEIDVPTQCEFIKKNGYGGGMVWALSNDDHNGKSCGQGKYPLLKTIANCLMKAGNSPVIPVQNWQTNPPTTEKQRTRPVPQTTRKVWWAPPTTRKVWWAPPATQKPWWAAVTERATVPQTYPAWEPATQRPAVSMNKCVHGMGHIHHNINVSHVFCSCHCVGNSRSSLFLLPAYGQPRRISIR